MKYLGYYILNPLRHSKARCTPCTDEQALFSCVDYFFMHYTDIVFVLKKNCSIVEQFLYMNV